MMPIDAWLARTGDRAHRIRRELLSAHVLNGASVALGMVLVIAALHAWLGADAAINANVGVILALIPDVVRARRGKFTHMIAAPLLGVPLYLAVQLLRPHPVELGLVLVAATFLAFLTMAWGRRGMPVAAAVMLAVLLGLAPLPAANAHEALLRTAHCALGAALYVLYGALTNAVLNGRYRAQLMADLLLTMAALLRTQAGRIASGLAGASQAGSAPTALGELLQRHAALADQLQATRDLVLESPRTRRRQVIAGMLMVVLEMRDRLIAGELDLERLRAHQTPELERVATMLQAMAGDVDQVADGLLLGRAPPPAQDHRAQLNRLRADALARAQQAPHDSLALAHAVWVGSICARTGDQDAAVRQLTALARGEVTPDLSAVRTGWQLFVSPAHWSLQPLLRLWSWRQPPLRHALRAALAIGAGYVVATLLPWVSHDYWILLTIVVVLRGNVAQTLQRRNERVVGTLFGALLATGLIALHPPTTLLLLAVIVSQGFAQAYAVRNYMVTAVAASVLGLVLAHLLHTGTSPVFALIERVGDTVLGAGIAWAFSYVLPTWERDQIAALVQRVRHAMAAHARQSLALATLDEITGKPELAWRLARREAYDALSALVQASCRALAEPRAVRPPLTALERLQAHSYQLLGQLSAVQSILLLRRDHLPAERIAQPVAEASERIAAALAPVHSGAALAAAAPDDGHDDAPLPAVAEVLPDPFEPDASGWLLRRLRLAEGLAGAVRADADRVLGALAATTTDP